MVHNNMVLDITLITAGPQMAILDVYTFYSRYNTDWIAYTEISLDPNNSVIKRLRCTCNFMLDTITQTYMVYLEILVMFIFNISINIRR